MIDNVDDLLTTISLFPKNILKKKYFFISVAFLRAVTKMTDKKGLEQGAVNSGSQCERIQAMEWGRHGGRSQEAGG